MMKKLLAQFWKWYEDHKTLNLGIATFLFALQIVHLIWLFGDVVWFKLTGTKIFDLHSHHEGDASIFSLENLILIVDYLEIPAILSTSLVYINEMRQKFNTRSLLFFFFINSQWLHLFWITDEFVVESLTGHQSSIVLPLWLAWVAILIDYLELPVVYDTMKKFLAAMKNEGITAALEELKEE